MWRDVDAPRFRSKVKPKLDDDENVENNDDNNNDDTNDVDDYDKLPRWWWLITINPTTYPSWRH